MCTRLSPRAVTDLKNARGRSKSTIDNRALPLLESAAHLDWSKLVKEASKVIDGKLLLLMLLAMFPGEVKLPFW